MNIHVITSLLVFYLLVNLPINVLDAQHNGGIEGMDTVENPDLIAVHPQFREWPTPSGDIEAQHNPAVFLWPIEKGQHITYDIRLSRNEDFSTIEFSRTEIPYAIYCPYEKLASGSWYWQYRVSGAQWSQPLLFKVTAASNDWDPPSRQVFKASIPKNHPRVLVRKGVDLKDIRNKTTDSKDVEYIINKADKNLGKAFLTEELNLNDSTIDDKSRLKKLKMDASKILGNTALEVVQSLAQGYVLTGREKYANRGVEWALYVAGWDPDGVTSLNDFGDSRCMLSMALAYDTFYDWLSETEKETLRVAIRARASHFYEKWINVIEAKVLSNHVWQHVFHYFFQTALATYGDIAEAEKWVEYLYELFLARAPALGPDDGAWVNGNSYFTMNMAVLLDVPLSIRDLTGFDFIKYKAWYQNNPYYLWYSFPPNSSSDGFADNSKGFIQPSQAYIAYADALGKITGNTYATNYAEAARKGNNIEITDDNSLRWIRIKYLSDIPQPEGPTLIDISQARLFPDAGMVYMNSQPMNTADNLMLAMRSSPWGSYGHMLADQNTFNILYGGKPLFFHSGHKISMNDPHRLQWYKHTRSHNGILINGQGQPYSTEAMGWIPRFLDGHYLSYAMGNASQAYKSKEHGDVVDYGVERFVRHVLMLYPDIIIIYDELESLKPVEWSWLIHSPGHMELERIKDHFLFTSSDVSSVVNVFGSTDLQWKVTDKYEVPAENWRGKKDSEGNYVELEDNDWHLKGISDSTRNMRYLAVIQIQSDHNPAPVTVDGNGHFLCGDWKIEAELDLQKSPGLAIYRRDGKVAFTTGASKIRLGAREYLGEDINSAKLVEIIEGEEVFQEASDQMPKAMKLAVKQMDFK